MAGFEDYSAQLQYNSRGYYEFVACSNHSVIYDGALTALLGSLQGDFAIISAFDRAAEKSVNISRGNSLRALLAEQGVWVYMLVGRWGNEQQCAVERAFLAVPSRAMGAGDFKDIILKCLSAGCVAGEAAIYVAGGRCCVLRADGKSVAVEADVTPCALSEIYSKCIKNDDSSFEFVGCESPVTNLGKQLFSHNKILY